MTDNTRTALGLVSTLVVMGLMATTAVLGIRAVIASDERKEREFAAYAEKHPLVLQHHDQYGLVDSAATSRSFNFHPLVGRTIYEVELLRDDVVVLHFSDGSALAIYTNNYRAPATFRFTPGADR